MSLKFSRFYISTCLPAIAVGLLALSTPAHAGFQWTPPEQAAPAPAPVLMPEPAPVEPTQQPAPAEEPVQMMEQPAAAQPVVTETATDGELTINPFPLNDADKEMPAEAVADEPVLLPMDSDKSLDQMEAQDVTVAPTTPEPAPVESATLEQPAEPSFDVVEGFGSDMPLALALRQIVPPRYAFSFQKGVNPGLRVSWDGGKPWNEVLNGMLSPFKIKAVITPKMVIIEPDNSPVVMEAPAEEHASVAPSNAPAPLAEGVDYSLEDGNSAPEPSALLPEPGAGVDEESVAVEPAGQDVSRKIIHDPGMTESAQGSADMALDTMPSEETLAMVEPEQVSAPSPQPEQPVQPQYHLTDSRVWEAKQGSSLKEILSSWSSQTGVKLVWQPERDYKLSSNVLISGSYENAVKVLFSKAVQNGPHFSFSAEQGQLVIQN
ncbi:MAG: TcpQ domain-containing protein [Alphaproteobacteria bacterium]|nr:TcpQ domain-containing protein [Alphaproteobacteria bacterium]